MVATKTQKTEAKGNGNGNGAKGLTGNEQKILKALSGGAALTRAELRKKTGINKGWSRALGASSKDDGGVAGKDSLEGRGYVASDRAEGDRQFTYKITAAGRKALEKAGK